MLSDIQLFLRALLSQGKEKLAVYRKGMAADVAAEIKELKNKWLDSWNPRLTSDEVPMNPYRVCWDLTHQLDAKKTILLHDAGVTRAYVSHHYEALNPLGLHRFRRHQRHGLVDAGRDGCEVGQSR